MYSNLKKAVVLAVMIGGGTLLPAGVSAQSSGKGNSAQTEEVPRSANYQLVPGDTVAVKVFREPDLETQQRLSKDGTINLPLLGVIRVVGKTTNEAASMIATLLDKDYVVHPQVSVSVTSYFKQKYTVLGSVTSPGSYDIPEEQSVDLLSAIARAGGFTRLARQSAVTIRRFTEGHEETFTKDVQRMIKDKNSERFIIQPNDSINVPERIF